MKAFQRDYLTRLKWAKSWLVGWMRIGLRFSHYFRNFQLLLRIFHYFLKFFRGKTEGLLICLLLGDTSWRDFAKFPLPSLATIPGYPDIQYVSPRIIFYKCLAPLSQRFTEQLSCHGEIAERLLKASCHWLEGIDNLWRYSKKYFQNCWPTNRM